MPCVQVLQQLGYLESDRTVALKGRVACEVGIFVVSQVFWLTGSGAQGLQSMQLVVDRRSAVLCSALLCYATLC